MNKSIQNNQYSVKYFGKLFLPLFFISVLSVSCGSSGGDGGISSGTSAPTDVSKGVITKTDANNVSVNGVDFNTRNTSVTIDDQAGSQDDLEVGMVVSINGRIDDNGNTGEAEHIEFEEEIQGPIDSIDAVNNRLVVLGRTVIIDGATRIVDENGSPLTFSDLLENDMLEVSGLIFTDDTIQATYIKKKFDLFFDDLSEVELKGTIKMLDVVAKIFFISNQAIDYNGSVQFEDMLESDLGEGLFVEVEGTRDSSGTLKARKIEKEDDRLHNNENTKVEIEAIVTAFTSSTSFSLSGQAVTTNANTRFEGGASDDIALNVRLEVEGRINASGVLVAKEIKFHGKRIKMESDVESIDTTNNTVTLFGQAVLINGATKMEDDSSVRKNDFLFSDIAPGDRLEIKAYLSDGVIIATKVEREDPKSEVKLQGPVGMVSDPDLKILSVTVLTNGSTTFEGRSENNITASDFFSQISTGVSVKVEGRLFSGDIVAEKIEIED
ncbi:MAG: DUF5666 domain-containing protein [Nitrospirota bacterium]|nr:DUF5666 domain-containing protein [Nitrospirota bacterium]